MVVLASQLSEIARIRGDTGNLGDSHSTRNVLPASSTTRCKDSQRRFYFDLTLEGKRAQTFKRMHRVPTLAAVEGGYDPAGGYWRGSVWAPTVTMVTRGLENFGYHALARDIAFNQPNMITKVFEKTSTIWENYAPDSAAPGKPARPDLAG